MRQFFGRLRNRASNHVRQLVKNEDGATAVEYAIIVALIAIVAIAGATSLGTAVNGTLSNAAAAMPSGSGGTGS